MVDIYSGREQTQAKHFILKRYLQELAFKVLTFQDITFVDGFSGPWETKTEDFRDSSFMIAISVLKDAQQRIFDTRGVRRKIGCFFSESNPQTHALLQEAVAPFDKPGDLFEIRTHSGEFEDAVSDIQNFIGGSFPLIFIDPTGWTGYPFDKIAPLFDRPKCEVLINFMFDYIRRFASSDDPATIASLNPILGGPGWRDRLDKTLQRGLGVEKLFRDTLRDVGKFRYVISTKIDKATVDRPHFFLAYGTKSDDGIKAFREVAYGALREHARNRATAQERQRERKSGTADLFPGHRAEIQEETIDEIVETQKHAATTKLLSVLSAKGRLPFSEVVTLLLEPYILRETNVKDICVALANAGKIENTWGGGRRKPHAKSPIILKLDV